MSAADRRIRIGVLGCAGIAWRRALPAMAGCPGVEVTAIAGRDGARAGRFAERFGGAPVTGYNALLRREDVDAVYVALPNALHHEWALRALRAGKHALVEKPLATRLTDAEALVGEARARGLVLVENFVFLRHAQHRAVRELVAGGAIGAPRAFAGSFGIPPRPADDIRYRAELGGGSLLDVGVYPLRAALYHLGDELTVAGAVLRTDPVSGVDVAGGALLRTGGGAIAQLSFGFEHAYRSTCRIWGERGHVSMDNAFVPPAGSVPPIRVELESGTRTLDPGPDDQFGAAVAAFAHAVRCGRAVPDPAGVTLRQARLVDEIRRCAARCDTG